MTKKYDKSQLIPIAVSFVIFAFALFIFAQSSMMSSNTSLQNLWFGVSGHVCVWVNDKLVECSPNIITRAGRNMTRDMLTFVNSSVVAAGINGTRFISLSTDSTATLFERSACPNEVTTVGLGRAEGDIFHVINYTEAASNISITRRFTATGTMANVQRTCLSNSSAASGSILFAEDTFTAVTLNSGDTINITWYVGVT